MSTLVKLVDKLREGRALGNEDTELKAAEREPLDGNLNVDGPQVRKMIICTLRSHQNSLFSDMTQDCLDLMCSISGIGLLEF